MQKLNAVLIVLIIILLFISVKNYAKYKNFMQGVWVAPDSFLEESNLSVCQMAIVNNLGILEMTDSEGKVIVDAKFKLSSRPDLLHFIPFVIFQKNILHLKATFKATDELPFEKCCISLDMTTGAMTIYHLKKVYMYLEKNTTLSNALSF